MKFAFRIIFAFVLATALASHFSACSNGEDYLYDEEQSTFIEVSAEMAYTFDSNSVRMKSDTLTPADTLIFIANILPSKSIKIKRYLWTIDGEAFSYDFSFRKNIEKPGLHKVAFYLETYLGDTLSDTLTLQVSNLPILARTSSSRHSTRRVSLHRAASRLPGALTIRTPLQACTTTLSLTG